MTDLVVGAAIGYSDKETEPWRVSLERTGYKGHWFLFKQASLEHHPIVERFKLIPQVFGKSRFVVATDVKDLLFQSNPITWLERNLGDYDIAVQSEGQLYRECPGNKKNMLEAFGQDSYEWIQKEPVMNAGVIAGKAEAVARLCREIYSLCLMDRRKNVRGITWDDMLPDQSALNLILQRPYWFERTLFCPPDSGFVSEYQHQLPREIRDGVLYPADSKIPYVMWHQYWWANGAAEKYRLDI